MKPKSYWLIGTIIILIIIGISLFIKNSINYNKTQDMRCKWEPGPCDALIGSGYYFNLETRKCEFFPPGRSGCSSPRFETLEDCNLICER